LAFLGSECDDQRNRIFREFCERGVAIAPPRWSPGGFAGFLFRHVGGDCTPISFNGKGEWEPRSEVGPEWPASEGGPYKSFGAWPPEDGRYFSSACLRPAFRLSKFRSVLSTNE